ncbi:MAG: hypothetical protein HEQ37_15655 [Acidovorax sp.]|nr:hypothetical protein [Acidovorax sp.]
MHRWLLIVLLSLALPRQAQAQPSMQANHIDANVPEDGKFTELLNRDLLAYFKATGAATATNVQVRLLRDAPTQSGVSYPKYYAWVQVQSGASRLAEGAVRLAAIERTRFEVTDYVPKNKAKGSRELVESVFPRPLVPDILRLAAE